MPPKAKFTRDEIIQAGRNIIRENGVEVLSARALGAKLSSSARTIFIVFQSMEEVQAEFALKLLQNWTAKTSFVWGVAPIDKALKTLVAIICKKKYRIIIIYQLLSHVSCIKWVHRWDGVRT